MKIHRSNLENALWLAIREQGEQEKKNGYVMDSGFLRGMKDLFEALERGENIEFIEE